MITRKLFGFSGLREKELQITKLRLCPRLACFQKIRTNSSGVRLPLSKSRIRNDDCLKYICRRYPSAPSGGSKTPGLKKFDSSFLRIGSFARVFKNATNSVTVYFVT